MTKPKFPRKRGLVQFTNADGELVTYAPSRNEEEWPLDRLIEALRRGLALPHAARDQILQHLLDLQQRLTRKKGGRPPKKSLTGREQMERLFKHAEQRAEMEHRISQTMDVKKVGREEAIEILASRAGIDPPSFKKKLYRKPRF